MSEFVILSWKTAGVVDSRTILDAEVDMQGIAEVWAHAGDDPQDMWAVQMIHLVKGTRRKDAAGRYITMSPLVTGYRKLDVGGWTYSPKYVSPKWERFFVWEMMGSREWMAVLESGDHYPTPENQLDKLTQIPPLVYRKPEKIERWIRQTLAAEQVFDFNLQNSSESARFLMFEDHTKSCVWPVRCQYFDGCHGSRDFDDSQAFVPRQPHHGFEAGGSQEAIDLREILKYSRGRRVVWLDRSRVLQRHRCPWSRYLEYHYRGSLGIRRKAMSIPLVTGATAHEGLAAILKGKSLEESIGLAIQSYDQLVRDYGLFEDGFGLGGDEASGDSRDSIGEASPFVVQEQRCLAEGLVRLANSRAVPPMLEWYDIQTVEKEVWRVLGEDSETVYVWQSRADALMRRKDF